MPQKTVRHQLLIVMTSAPAVLSRMLFKPPLSLMVRNILISSLRVFTAGLPTLILNVMF